MYVPKCRKCEKRFVLIVPEIVEHPLASHYVEANDQATAMDPGPVPTTASVHLKQKVLRIPQQYEGPRLDVDRTFVAPASAAGATNNASARWLNQTG